MRGKADGNYSTVKLLFVAKPGHPYEQVTIMNASPSGLVFLGGCLAIGAPIPSWREGVYDQRTVGDLGDGRL